MAKLTCDSLLDLTSNAKMVTGSPVPYNRFMKASVKNNSESKYLHFGKKI